MTILQLKEYFQENPWVADKIMHYGSRIRTTKSYWNSRCSKLLDMVHQLGAPTVFFTSSSADYHWPDLYRLLGYDVTSLRNAEKSIIFSQNPLVADIFFYLRSKFFLEKAFKEKFKRVNTSARFLWIQNAPSIKEFMSPDEEKNVINFFDDIISCENPDIMSYLQQLIHRHTKCSRSHCLRPVGNGKSLECRNKFLKSLASETTLEKQDGKVVDINFHRNDPLLNKFNKWVQQTWRANIHFSPKLNQERVYRYIAKYSSKSEIKSLCYNEVLSDIRNKSSDDADLSKKAVRKLLVSSCAERDYCAQEVMHYLMGYHFCSCLRDFVELYLIHPDWSSITYSSTSRNFLDYYAKRSPDFEKLSLFHVAKYFKVFEDELISRSKPAFVRFFPRCVKERNGDSFYAFMSQLFYPWRSMDDLQIIDDYMKHSIDLSYDQYVKAFDIDKSSESDDPSHNDVPQPSEKDKESILSSFNPNKNCKSPEYKNFNDETYEWDYMSSLLSRKIIHVLQEKIQTKNTVFSCIKTLTDDIAKGIDVKGSFNIVQGMQGTGKTFLLKCCVHYICCKLGQSSVKVIAPTGVAAKLTERCS
ncbi:4-hydroxy-tetrahydrodipicolinate reductase [Frankliniella fusca]|uniref:4-hydroxy-tetrahydrodipicolinate reductase n=1 Tax=Frankliniella fusca TaxID=407009 RepID=A0AAE1L9K4_9NEOP|nr:4-hydroxy-tetrahydrodipicolinate reductase [Frankliniella fusca]